MSVNNNYRFVLRGGQKYINLPLEIKWDFSGRDDDIEQYEKGVLLDVIGSPLPFEINQYSHKEYGQNNFTAINYKFYFYDSIIPVTATTIANSNLWINSYLFNNAIPSGFSATDVYYYRKPFTNSFFKLDFYDTPNTVNQRNFFTVILPVQQGETQTVSISPLIPPVQIRKPSMVLDFVKDKEGFFIYWLRKPDVVSLDTFYMSAKFFDAKNGVFVRMMNTPQSDLSNKFTFDNSQYFYYKVKLNYETKRYEVFDSSNVRVGKGITDPINWYEYINS